MGSRSPDVITKLLMNAISEEELSVHKIVRETGLDYRTIKRYLDLIIEVQRMPKITKKLVGLRVVVKRKLE